MLEKLVLRNANAVVCVSRALGASLLRKSGRSSLPLAVVPNGYDEEDFRQSEPARGPGWHIVYCGSLGRLVDPSNFLRACAMFVARRPQLRRRLRLMFVGEAIGADFESLAAELGLHDIAQFTGYVPHHEAVRYLRSADVLLLLLTGTTSQDVVPGKIFEYLRAGKRILAIMPPGETAELLRTYAPGSVICENTVEAIEQAMAEVLARPGDKPWVNSEGVTQFERRRLAGQFARVLEAVSGVG
jgi:glycosyltransferase involved in cell wall biosynthesis